MLTNAHRLAAWLGAQLAHAGLTWLRHDLDQPSPVPENAKFVTPRQAAAMVRDGDVVAVSGLGGNQRASILFWAIRDAFRRTGHPADLTLVNLGGHGGRGLAPGTMEELGQRGLCRRLVTGHFETFRAMLALAAAGDCELQCIPQGTLARLIDALGHGADSLWTTVGVGTFVDPRVGRGSRVGDAGAQLVTAEDGGLRWRMPAIDVALFNAPAADRHGNVYVRGASTIGETAEIARAARRRGGRVIANVGMLVEPDPGAVYLSADCVDAVVHHPDTEQAAGIPHRRHWAALTPACDAPIADALAAIRLVNRVALALRPRSPADDATARLAAATLASLLERGDRLAIGTGLPEMVPPLLHAAGLHETLTMLVESGTVGGVPASGIYFGAAVAPREIVSSAELFRRCGERLDAACLGVLEVDGDGHVNASRRSDAIADYVGPGGFLDLASAARTLVLVSRWMVGGTITAGGGAMRVGRPGPAKLVARVREVTFAGRAAVAAGARIFWATPVGLFRVEADGIAFVAAMPGVDVARDVVAATPVPLRVAEPLPRLPASVVTGEGFAPRLGGPIAG